MPARLRPLDLAFTERLRDRRAGLIADTAFQRWATRSPLTRWLARRKARALFDISAGFVYSQILSACVKLGVFEFLQGGPAAVEAVAADAKLEPPAALRLLKAAASIGLLKRLRDGRFALDDLGAATIGNPGVAAFVAHHDLFYADLADPVALLRGERATELSQFWTYAGSPAERESGPGGNADTGPYSALMSRTNGLVAESVLDAYPFARRGLLLDVGGGEGDFAIRAARRFPALKIILFDLPSVAERARARIEAAGLGAQVTVAGGDMLSDPLPEGADVATLVRVLHDHDDAEAAAILAAVRRALPQNGDIVVAEPMSGIAGAELAGDAYFGLYFMAMGRGRARAPDEIASLLMEAGFHRPLRLRTPNPLTVSVMTAYGV